MNDTRSPPPPLAIFNALERNKSVTRVIYPIISSVHVVGQGFQIRKIAVFHILVYPVFKAAQDHDHEAAVLELSQNLFLIKQKFQNWKKTTEF